jgi:hypothetical protein
MVETVDVSRAITALTPLSILIVAQAGLGSMASSRRLATVKNRINQAGSRIRGITSRSRKDGEK